MYPIYIFNFIHIQVLAYDVSGEALGTLTVRMSFKITKGSILTNIIGVRECDNLFCDRDIGRAGLNMLIRNMSRRIMKGYQFMKNDIIAYCPRQVHKNEWQYNIKGPQYNKADSFIIFP
jgi:hypothetical protein